MTDDLVPLLVPDPGNENLRFGQAGLVAWNPATFENTVLFKGVALHNLPVAAGVDGLTWQPGDQLILHGYAPNGGLGSWWIAQRVIIPGRDAAAKTLSFLRTSLAAEVVDDLVAQLLVSPAGQDLAAFVLGQRVHSASVFSPGTRNNTSYGNLTGGGPGPTLTGVQISEAGRAIAICTAQCTVADNAGRSGYMSVAVSGASTVPANDGWAYVADIGGTTDGQTISPRAGSLHLFTDLNPGAHTFTSQYRTLTTGGSVTWLNRNLTVIAF